MALGARVGPMKRPCIEPRCPGYAERGARCLLHARQYNRAKEAARPPGLRQMYSSAAWRKLRAEAVAGGQCHWCGVVAVRLVGDHVVSPIELPDLALEPANVVPSCYSCNLKRGRRWAGVRP